MRVKPERHGVSFIVHTAGDPRDTWSKAFRFCGNAEDCVRELVEGSKGLRGRLEITKYYNGKPVDTYAIEGC